MTDEATKAEVIAGFYCCLKLANIISSTTGKLAQGKLAEETRIFFQLPVW